MNLSMDDLAIDLSNKYLTIDIKSFEEKVLSHEQRDRFVALFDKYSSQYLISFLNNELRCLIKFNGFNSKVLLINVKF